MNLKVKLVENTYRAFVDRTNTKEDRWKTFESIYEIKDDDSVRAFFPFKKGYISRVFSPDKINRCFRRGWIYYIISQMGSGKTTFVADNLVAEAQKTGELVLILFTRVAIADSMKRKLLKKYSPEVERDYTSEGLRHLIRIANVDVLLIQHCERKEIIEYIRASARNYRVVVFDECHALVDDAAFIDYSGDAYHRILKWCRASTRIYMSATMRWALDPLIEAEKDSYSGLDYSVGFIPRITIYSFEFVFDYVQPIFFRSQNQVIKYIQKRKDERTLIFVDTKEKGRELLDVLNKETSGLASFIDAQSKNADKRDEYDRIVEEKKFDPTVLICTKFLAMGVDLIDDEFKNIIIFTLDRDDCIQQLGRKRIKDSGDELKLLLYEPTQDEVNNRIRRITNELKVFRENKDNIRTYEYGTKLPDHFVGVQVRNRVIIKPSMFYECLCKNQISQLRLLRENARGEMLSWIPGCKEPGKLDKNGDITFQSANSELDEFLSSLLDKEMTKEKMLPIQRRIFEICDYERRPDQKETFSSKILNELLEPLGYVQRNKSGAGKKGIYEIGRL